MLEEQMNGVGVDQVPEASHMILFVFTLYVYPGMQRRKHIPPNDVLVHDTEELMGSCKVFDGFPHSTGVQSLGPFERNANSHVPLLPHA